MWGPGGSDPPDDGVPAWSEPPPHVRTLVEQTLASHGMQLPLPLPEALRACQGSEKGVKLPAMCRIDGTPPDDPNVFTDGSVDPSDDRLRTMAGAGCWAPGKPPPDILEQFRDFVFDECDATARRMWTSLSGTAVSSARAEIVGLIIGQFLDAPVHIGIDNSGVVRRFQRFLRHEWDEERFPFGLVRDGDLWCEAITIARQRGIGSNKVAKVLGHATQAHAADGEDHTKPEARQ